MTQGVPLRLPLPAQDLGGAVREQGPGVGQEAYRALLPRWGQAGLLHGGPGARAGGLAWSMGAAPEPWSLRCPTPGRPPTRACAARSPGPRAPRPQPLSPARPLPQVPIHALWNDGRENLLGALLLAGLYVIPEVPAFSWGWPGGVRGSALGGGSWPLPGIWAKGLRVWPSEGPCWRGMGSVGRSVVHLDPERHCRPGETANAPPRGGCCPLCVSFRVMYAYM